MSLGPIMFDIQGLELSAEERELLCHPLAGGVILFARNYHDPAQLQALTAQLHAVREPRLLIAVDHEGGRVQRFHQGFTRLPPAACFGDLYARHCQRARDVCEEAGWLLASELLAAGVDLSFAPVLDLNYGVSAVIGDRAFHRDVDVVSNLAHRLMCGMRSAGMTAVGKHFPGHGYVAADSHHITPIDERCYADILMQDMVPFERLINQGLSAIMPAHVIYPAVDERPAGFSRQWLQDVLRQQLGFTGAVFSDDISMAGAEVAGGYTERAEAALAAGCDMVLICNNHRATITVLDELRYEHDPVTQVRIMRLHGRPPQDISQLLISRRHLAVAEQLAQLTITPERDLDDDQITT